jgi:hypothetical protein
MPLFSKLTNTETGILAGVAAALNVSPEWLYALIDFESKWQPAATNPLSGAMGLLQFTNTTARGMGYKSAADLAALNPTRGLQLLGPVYDYLHPLAPFPTQQSLTMAVFYPKYRTVAPDTLFPANVLAVNPGLKPLPIILNGYFQIGKVR